jgi:hypothetical protein
LEGHNTSIAADGDDGPYSPDVVAGALDEGGANDADSFEQKQSPVVYEHNPAAIGSPTYSAIFADVYIAMHTRIAA